MLDLLLAADKAARTTNQKLLLEALMEDDGRGIQRVMERESRHEILFEDSFFTPFMGLMAAQGSREAWRTLQDWGYSMQSDIRDKEERFDRNSMTLGGWVCQFLPPERLSSLIEWKVLDPFNSRAGKSRMHAGEYGMLGGNNELFDFWLDKWKQNFKKTPSRYKTLPTLMETASGMLRWQEDHSEYPASFPTENELSRRIDGIVDAISDHFYEAPTRKDQWAALIKTPPTNSKSFPVSVFVGNLAQRVDNPWEDPTILEKAMKGANYHFVAALLDAGIPLDTPYAAQVPRKILKTILETGEGQACAWHAWCNRARVEFPQKLASLPASLTRKHANVRSHFTDSKAKNAATLQAIELIFATTDAPAPKRAGPRL
jgi:hypothetical protein